MSAKRLLTSCFAILSVDDNGLARLISSTPANSMILIEDIDCAFPARDKKKDLEILPEDLWGAPAEKKSKITLSGLLNVLDGVSSEEGRLLFATVGETVAQLMHAFADGAVSPIDQLRRSS